MDTNLDIIKDLMEEADYNGYEIDVDLAADCVAFTYYGDDDEFITITVDKVRDADEYLLSTLDSNHGYIYLNDNNKEYVNLILSVYPEILEDARDEYNEHKDIAYYYK